MNFLHNFPSDLSLLRIGGKGLVWDNKPVLYFTGLTIFFFTIGILQTGQDFLHAHLYGYQGYLSDSLIFKIYWLIFIPVLCFLFCRAAQIKEFFYKKRLLALAGIFLLSLIHIFLTAFLIMVISNMFFHSPFSFSTPFNYYASEHFYLTLFFYGSGAAFILFHKESNVKLISLALNKSSEVPEPLASEKFIDFIPVSVQNKVIPVPVKNITCIRTDRPYIRIHTCSDQYLHTSTLKVMLIKLGTHRFVRIHRSVIINRQQVEHIKSRSNGDYDVTLKNGEVVRMSRNYYAAFKKTMV